MLKNARVLKEYAYFIILYWIIDPTNLKNILLYDKAVQSFTARKKSIVLSVVPDLTNELQVF